MVFVVANGFILGRVFAYVEYFEIVMERFARACMPFCNLISKDMLLSHDVVLKAASICIRLAKYLCY